MADPINPFWQVYNKFWELLEANTYFDAAVPDDARHRIKFTSTTDRRPDRDTGLTADYPKVRVVSRGMSPKPYHTSNGTLVVAKWAIEVFVGDQRMDHLFDVTFAILMALMDWQSHFTNLTHGSDPFHVCRCFPVDVTETVNVTKDTAGVTGWVSVWEGITDIWFSSALLKTPTGDS